MLHVGAPHASPAERPTALSDSADDESISKQNALISGRLNRRDVPDTHRMHRFSVDDMEDTATLVKLVFDHFVHQRGAQVFQKGRVPLKDSLNSADVQPAWIKSTLRRLYTDEFAFPTACSGRVLSPLTESDASSFV